MWVTENAARHIVIDLSYLHIVDDSLRCAMEARRHLYICKHFTLTSNIFLYKLTVNLEIYTSLDISESQL